MAGTFGIKTDGLKASVDSINSLDPTTGRGWVRSALIEAGNATTEASRAAIRTGSGPAVAGILTSRTGELRKSIGLYRKGLPKFIEVGTPLAYGWMHERGGKIQKRPFLQPGLAASLAQIEEIFRRKAAEAAEKAGRTT